MDTQRQWNHALAKNEEREIYLKKQYLNIISNLIHDNAAGVSITGGNSFVENEIENRLSTLQYKDIYVYEIEKETANWYKVTNYIVNAMKKYSKYIFLREIDILSDYPHNISFISNDIQGGSLKTNSLNTYKKLNITGALQIIHALIGKNIKEVGWLCNTSVRPQGVQHYLDIFNEMKIILAKYRIHCKYETRGSSCYNKNMYTFGGVFKADGRLANQTLQNIGIELIGKGYLLNESMLT
jgi:hypothetical protein